MTTRMADLPNPWSALSRLIIVLLPLTLLAGPATAAEYEWNIDRQGGDYRSFELAQANPALCRTACNDETRCQSWTYQRPDSAQGQNARCWLKEAVPARQSSACCISGTKTSDSASFAPVNPNGSAPDNAKLCRLNQPFTACSTDDLEVDRPGHDYADFDGDGLRTIGICRDRCLAEPRCMAWVAAVLNESAAKVHCWLKEGISRPVSFTANDRLAGLFGGEIFRKPPPNESWEFSVDRPGSDLSAGQDLVRDDPALCATACAANGSCRAWTYVKPGVQGPNPRCWLKNAVPGARANDCCVSGLR